MYTEISKHALERSRQQLVKQLSAYRDARRAMLYAKESWRLTPRTLSGLKCKIAIERLTFIALDARQWYYTFLRRHNEYMKREVTPFGGRISPNAVMRHNRRHGK